MVKRKLTQKQKETRIIQYIENAKRAMGLSIWTISVDFEHLHKDNSAHVTTESSYYQANVTINLKWVDRFIDDLARLGSTVFHELNHVIDSPVKNAYTESIRILSETNKQIVAAWIRSETERATTLRTMLHDNYSSSEQK